MPIPPKVLVALNHVREFCPDVTIVVFKRDTRWIYLTDDHEVPAFPSAIDVGILDDAVDDVSQFPSVFELVDSKQD